MRDDRPSLSPRVLQFFFYARLHPCCIADQSENVCHRSNRDIGSRTVCSGSPVGGTLGPGRLSHRPLPPRTKAQRTIACVDRSLYTSNGRSDEDGYLAFRLRGPPSNELSRDARRQIWGRVRPCGARRGGRHRGGGCRRVGCGCGCCTCSTCSRLGCGRGGGGWHGGRGGR